MKINELNIKYLLDKPDKKSIKCAILLPGISGGALTSRYDLLANYLRKSGFYFLRFNLWNSVGDLEGMTLEEVYNGINKAVEYMESLGCKKLSFIGKSFGGGVLLTYLHPKVSSLVLWAPAIQLSNESNLNKVKKLKISELSSFSDIRIAKEDLQKIKVPTLIIHGTRDETISLKNSENIVKNLPRGVLETIKDAGHSYEKEGEMDIVARTTVGFLRSFN